MYRINDALIQLHLLEMSTEKPGDGATEFANEMGIILPKLIFCVVQKKYVCALFQLLMLKI